jgi:hypothetical protein
VLSGKSRRSTAAAVRRDLREREMVRCTACLRASTVGTKAAAAHDSRERFGRRTQERAGERFLREIEVTYGGAAERRSKAKGKTVAAHNSGQTKP